MPFVRRLAALAFATLCLQAGEGVAGVDPKLPPYRPASGVSGTLSGFGEGAASQQVVRWVEAFGKLVPPLESEIAGRPGTGDELARGRRGFEARSRALRPEELEAFVQIAKHEPTVVRVSLDVLAIYVHAKNPVAKLTLAQVEAIFSPTRKRGAPEDLTTWGQLGLTGEWVTRPVATSCPGGDAPSSRFFRELVLAGGDLKPNVADRKSIDALLAAVKADPGAIAFAPIGAKPAGFRAVPIVGTEDRPYEPTEADAAGGRYPISRSIYLYVNRTPGKPLPPPVREFVRYVLSREGQEILAASGSGTLGAGLAAKERAKVE